MATTPHHLSNKHHILVAGAGVGGLAFAISLHKLWPGVSSSAPPRITIFERDPEATPQNRQGYSLSLRSDNPTAGIQTLQKLGLLEKMVGRSVSSLGEDGKEGGHGGFCVWGIREGSGGEKVWERHMKVAAKLPEGCPVSSLRIARAELRRTLVEEVEQLPGVKIHWGVTVIGVEDVQGKVQVDIERSKPVTGDLLVAADGSSSKIRSLLRPHDRLQFAGPACIYALAPIKDLHPSGRGDEFGAVISGAGRALFLAPVDHNNMVWCLSWLVDSPPPPRRQPLSDSDTKELLTEARKQGLHLYGNRFERLLLATDLSTLTQFNAMDKPAFAHSEGYIQAGSLNSLQNKVLFIGDANHAVSPFAGNGANLALMDGWDLADTLLHGGSNLLDTQTSPTFDDNLLKNVIEKYDARAVARAKQVVRISHFNIRVMHSHGWWTTFWFVVLNVIRWLFFRNVE